MADGGARRRQALRSLLQRHRTARAGDLERDVAFSWPRALVAVFSYALLLSDVLRTGPAMRVSPYADFEPNRGVYYVYPVVHLPRNETGSDASAEDATNVWAYKFDTTSISIRAVAEHLRVAQWPPCVLYASRSAPPSVSSGVVFEMLDSFVAAMAQRSSLPLRTRSAWFDRVHNFVLPWFFDSSMPLTNHAIYYDARTLRSPRFHFYARDRERPDAALDVWSNLARLCATTKCQQVGRVFDHALERLRALQRRYAGLAVDLVVLEGNRDYTQPELSHEGRKLFDIVVVARVRDCGHSQRQPYALIAVLRGLGQSYMWLRVLLLVVGCYRARAAEPKFAAAGFARRALAALRTVLLIPNQAVVYGSAAPIACYVAAHMLNSAIAYEVAAQRFTTQLGAFHVDPHEVVRLSAVSMRSVWVLALLFHCAVYTDRLRRRSSIPSDGSVLGVSELVVTCLACLTVMAQFRSTRYRYVKVLAITEIPPSPHVAALRTTAYSNASGFVTRVMVGTRQDLKCLFAVAVVLGVVALGAAAVLRLASLLGVAPRVDLLLWSRSPVSLAGGTLWPTNALVVSWNGLFVVHESSAHPSATSGASSRRHPTTSRQIRVVPTAPVRASGSASIQLVQTERPAASPRRRPNKPMGMPTASLIPATAAQSALNGTPSRSRHALLQRSGSGIAEPNERTREAESMLYLMNLAAMTDPIPIGVFESRVSRRLCLLPLAARPAAMADELALVAETRSAELPWSDLLHCG